MGRCVYGVRRKIKQATPDKTRAAPGTSRYWQNRYASGGDSGLGSRGSQRLFKLEVINKLINDYGIHSIADLGCGDGQQLVGMAPCRYYGCDVSECAINICLELFKKDASKLFSVGIVPSCAPVDMAMSLDVVYHLVSTRSYRRHLDDLVALSTRFVLIYSSNIKNAHTSGHVRHRLFVRDIQRNYAQHLRLKETMFPPPELNTVACFYLYERLNVKGGDLCIK